MSLKPCTREAVALLTATPLDEALAVLDAIQNRAIGLPYDAVAAQRYRQARAHFAALVAVADAANVV